ncbi:hypothetical protein GQ53DRAFT_685467 [Thozetella sp. PMI_491]|nr:hypothetical protein GQ53DRAFT_685467 [Thozetella sp. PMI_491]
MSSTTTEEEKRLALVRTILEGLQLEVSTITPLGRAFNNFAWTVEVGAKSLSATPAAQPLQPGTIPIPADITKVVVRMGNPAASLNESVRVQNEVAAIQLSRDACSAYPRKIIPDVYGWQNKTESAGYGWIVEEFMPGEQLLPAFPDLPADAQQSLLNEMASIYKCLTSYRLPASVKGFGGLGYDEKGDVVAGPIVFDFGGPWATYEDMYIGTLDKQLSLADGSPLFKGWRRDGLRERLDKFRAEGIAKVLEELTDKTPTLIHGDFDLINMMFDPATNTITGLLDFDFAHIAGPADELFYSFAEIHGLMLPIFEDRDDLVKLRRFLIGEADLPLPAPAIAPASSLGPSDEGEVQPAEPAKKEQGTDWAIAAKWNSALLNAKATRPCDIAGIDSLSNLYWFIQEVCSPFTLMPGFIARASDEKKMEKVTKAEKGLIMCLEYWGY